MLRRTSLNRSVPLKRVSWKRKSRRKPTVAEGSRYLAACRGEACYLRIPGVCCSIDWSHPTVVPCHSNLLGHGKGIGLKADHRFTVPGCALCHYWLDQGVQASKEQRRAAFLSALRRWYPVRCRKLGEPERSIEDLDRPTLHGSAQP